MGLDKAGNSSHWAALLGVPGALLLTTIGLEIGGDELRQLCRYDTEGIVSGELYRLVTGHLVHLGWRHLLMNLAGLVLVWLLVGDRYSTWQWIAITVICMIVIDLGLLTFMPDLAWYVGLSGVLHGLLTAGAIALLDERRIEATILLVALGAKVSYEMLFGAMPGSEAGAGGWVIVEAHLFGAIGGALSALFILWRRKQRTGTA